MLFDPAFHDSIIPIFHYSNLLFFQFGCCIRQSPVFDSPFTVLASSMRSDGDIQRKGPQVCSPAEEFNRSFRVIVLQFPINGAHRAQVPDAAVNALGRS